MTAIPTPVRRVETPAGLAFLFPRIPPGPCRNTTFALLAAGAILALVGGAVALAARADGDLPAYGLYFALLGTAGACVAAAAAFRLGMRTEIRLAGEFLVVVWSLGPVRFPRPMPVSLSSVVVEEYAIYVTYPGGRRNLAWGYPAEWLRPVARELGSRRGLRVLGL
jgi:hypothetical protein